MMAALRVGAFAACSVLAATHAVVPTSILRRVQPGVFIMPPNEATFRTEAISFCRRLVASQSLADCLFWDPVRRGMNGDSSFSKR